MKPNTRFVNNCGRINIPFRIRKQVGITENTPVRVKAVGEQIIIEKVKTNEPR